MQENYHIAADALFRENKQIFTPRMSEFSIKYSKQANLLMIVGGKERHYTGIKNKTAKSKKSSSFPLLYELLLFIYIYIYIYIYISTIFTITNYKTNNKQQI